MLSWLPDDPYEKSDLADEEQYTDLVLQMKQKILEEIKTKYVSPQPQLFADWRSEALNFIEDGAWNSGWCSNVTITIN